MYRVLYRLQQRSPWFRRTQSHIFYNYLSGLDATGVVTLLNLGYAYLDAQIQPIPLAEEDEPNRYALQLYHCIAAAVDLNGRDVLEVGSGRGGGASYVKRYLGPRTVTGVDFSEVAVAFCQQYYRMEGLRFMHGDAEDLPLGDEQFDAVINVESSHHYGAMDRFFGEVRRVLRPGGYLLWGDCWEASQLADLESNMRTAGLAPVTEEVITPHVLESMRQQHARIQETINQSVPRIMRGAFRHYAGLEGTCLYDQFASGEMVYLRMVLRKP